MKKNIIAILVLTFTAQQVCANSTLKFGEKLARNLGEFINDAPNTQKLSLYAQNNYIKKIELNRALNPLAIQFTGVKGLPPRQLRGLIHVTTKNGDPNLLNSGDEMASMIIHHSTNDLMNPYLQLTVSKVLNGVVKNDKYDVPVAEKIIRDIAEKITKGVQNINVNTFGQIRRNKLTVLFIDGAAENPGKVTSLINQAKDIDLLRYSFTSKIPLSKLEVEDIEILQEIFLKVIAKSSDDAIGEMTLELPGI